MKTIIIGDIHGCLREFHELLAAAGISTGSDRIIATGDLIDQGPSSLEVVRYFRDTPNALSVRGNHEEKALRGRIDEENDPSWKVTAAMYSDTECREIKSFISTLPLAILLEEALVVHAGVMPGIPLERQDRRALLGVGSQGREHFAREPFWYDLIDYPRPVVYGHAVSDAVVRGARGNVYGIDSGCCLGGKLRGLLLPSFDLVEVPASADYWSALRQTPLPDIWRAELGRMSWKRMERLDADLFDDAFRRQLAEAYESRERMVKLVTTATERLRMSTGYRTLDPRDRRALCTALLGSAASGEPVHLFVDALAHGPSLGFVTRHLPTPAALAGALTSVEALADTMRATALEWVGARDTPLS